MHANKADICVILSLSTASPHMWCWITPSVIHPAGGCTSVPITCVTEPLKQESVCLVSHPFSQHLRLRMQNQSMSEHIPTLNWDQRGITYKNLNSLSVTEAVSVIISRAEKAGRKQFK